MKALITGDTEYSVSVTNSYLIDNRFEVKVLDNLPTGHEKYKDKRSKFFLGDI
jgi:UDP-glucose 4-epimerase